MSQFQIYKSNDREAPILNGTSGSLLNLLNYCLVGGYGTGSYYKAPAGWTKSFDDSGNVGSFLMTTGSGFGVVLDDSAQGAASTREARWTGFHTLSAYNTGSIPFPTTAQGVGGAWVIVRKSGTLDSASRDWIIFAESRSVYAFIKSDFPSTYTGVMFGDINSVKTGSFDQYGCMIAGRNTANTAALAACRLDALSALATGTGAQFLAYPIEGTGNPVTMSKHGDGTKGSTTALLGSVPYLNGTDSGIYLSPVWVCEPRAAATSFVRGKMRGFYQFCHAIVNVDDQMIFSGSRQWAGRTFLVLKQSGNTGVYLMETSDTLDL